MKSWQEEFNEKLQFIEEQKKLVGVAIPTTGVSIMLLLNNFNLLEREIARVTLICFLSGIGPDSQQGAAKQLYAKNGNNLDRAVRDPRWGFRSKVNYLESIIKEVPCSNLEKIPKLLHGLADIRNDIVHGIYDVDPERFRRRDGRFIIVIRGRDLDQEDFLEITGAFGVKYDEVVIGLQRLKEAVGIKDEK